jgi:hypothetical protein
MKNNNNFLLLVLALMLISTTFAQETKVGLRLGIGLPNLESTDNNIYSKDYTTVAGFDGGFFLDYGLTENFSIKTELYYARKGGERDGMQPIPPAQLDPQLELISGGKPVWATFDNRAVFDYIGIPVLAKYEWHLGDKWGVYANAGLYVEFIIDPKQETSGTSQLYYDEAGTMPLEVPVNVNPDPNGEPIYMLFPLPPVDLTATTDINDDLSNMDFGAIAGVGVSYALNDTSELLFDARGSYGFIPLQSDTTTYGKVHMGSFTFSLGYAYTIKNRSKKDETND